MTRVSNIGTYMKTNESFELKASITSLLKMSDPIFDGKLLSDMKYREKQKQQTGSKGQTNSNYSSDGVVRQLKDREIGGGSESGSSPMNKSQSYGVGRGPMMPAQPKP